MDQDWPFSCFAHRLSSFKSVQICDQVIEAFNGKPIGEKGSELQIRYSDTDNQKKLKTQTAERRQFKTAEYNTAVFAMNSPYGIHSPFPTAYSSPLQNRGTGITGGGWSMNPPLSPVYVCSCASTCLMLTISDRFQAYAQPYPQMAPYYAAHAMPLMAGGRPFTENDSPVPTRYNARIKIENPSVVTPQKSVSMETVEILNNKDTAFMPEHDRDTETSPSKRKH